MIGNNNVNESIAYCDTSIRSTILSMTILDTDLGVVISHSGGIVLDSVSCFSCRDQSFGLLEGSKLDSLGCHIGEIVDSDLKGRVGFPVVWLAGLG